MDASSPSVWFHIVEQDKLSLNFADTPSYHVMG